MNELKADKKQPAIELSPLYSRTIKKTLAAEVQNETQVVEKDPSWMERFRAGDQALLKSIYETHFRSVARFVQKNNGSQEEARDLFQDALLVVYQKVSKPGFALTCQLGTFIYAVASRLWKKKLRDERPLALLTTGEVDELVNDDLEDLIRRMKRFKLYEQKFAQLSPACQAVLQSFLQGKRTSEVMEEFGFGSISYTKKRKCLCKGNLMKMIMEDPEYKALTDHE